MARSFENLYLSIRHREESSDEKILVQYLQHIFAHRDAAKKLQFFLKQFEEDENEMREAIALAKPHPDEPKVTYTPSSDRKFLRLMDEYESAKKVQRDELLRLRVLLREEIGFLHLFKNAVLSLKEPERSIFLLRYFEKKPWGEIQKRIGKSSSYSYRLHANGLTAMVQILGEKNLSLLREKMHGKNSFPDI